MKTNLSKKLCYLWWYSSLLVLCRDENSYVESPELHIENYTILYYEMLRSGCIQISSIVINIFLIYQMINRLGNTFINSIINWYFSFIFVQMLFDIIIYWHKLKELNLGSRYDLKKWIFICTIWYVHIESFLSE